MCVAFVAAISREPIRRVGGDARAPIRRGLSAHDRSASYEEARERQSPLGEADPKN